ncbi:hypothetical protein NPX13_g9261 [Xylaria arbuscula]|uniref:Fork-head domain-containing protein n=1 Tax=Xylaria arbuscula TaxID=114810 RepID=A0A9W8THM9_9PEZI|nr:hypothetical protein NPX13_g9261 [Xylaria arbuscula]
MKPTIDTIEPTHMATAEELSFRTNLPDRPQSSHDQLAEAMNIDPPTIPSPPTVSPLSTPAATHINVDDLADEDDLINKTAAKPTSEPPSLSLIREALASRNARDFFGPSQPLHHRTSSAPDEMQLDEPFMSDLMSYRRQSQVQAIATTDPDPHGADFSHGLLSGMRLSQGSIDPSAYIMNIAAQATLFPDQGPPVVAPSAVSLHSLAQESDAFTGSVEPASTNGSQKLESFAKIEFADSTFQMTTYAVIIGRDQQAMEQARADERREAAYRRRCEENERNGLPPPTPVMHDKGRFSKSYVSEEGGMLGPEHSDGEDVKPTKKRRPSSAAHSAAGDDSASLGNHVQSNRQYVSHTTGAAAVDLGALQPSPEHIPFIGIHSPGPDIATKTRVISRQHLKIQFNKKKGVFEGIALHKNGFFCEDVLYKPGEPATLKSGDRLQIKDVEFSFVINGVQLGMTGGEDEDVASSKRMSVGGKEMSLDFEHSDHENFRDTSEDLSDIENIPTPVIESEHGGEESGSAPMPAATPVIPSATIPGPVPGPEAAAAGTTTTTDAELMTVEDHLRDIIKPELDLLGELPPDFAMPDIPKRRGPGRPPKDGIMSKRERRLLKKQLQETSKKTLPQDPQEEKIKRPVGRPRKNPLPEDGQQPEKRKYNKKKREDGEEGSDVEKRIKEKKDKKVRPKSPPLELRIEDYTAEQLQKPTKNYGVLIDEALTNGPLDGLTLKQIYKRITARYPWFYFRSETKGWESSVRHNLIGNEAFKKDDETGLWSRVPGVELDAGKKRKATSPDRLGPSHLHSHLSHSPYYHSNPYTNTSNVTYAHGLPNYHTEQKVTQPSYTSTGQNAQLQTTPSQPVAPSVYTPHVPAPAQLPPGYGSITQPRPVNTPQQSTYSSPYARPPPPTSSTKVETVQANTQTATVSSTPQPAAPTQQQQPKPSVTSAAPREQLSPEIERAIVQFSANMLNVISKQTPHAAAIIEAAANRVRGLPVHNRIPGFDSVENTLINAMQGMIRDMKQKHHYTASASPAPSAPAQASSTPSPAPPNTAEAEIQRRLRNFRESMVKALKMKTDKAEIIVDSAINRARGLPHAAKIPGWEEADDLMVKSVTQIIAEARSAHSQKIQKASPSPANTSRPAGSHPPQPVPRTNPSASPAPAQPPVHICNIPARPNIPLQRPAPVSLTRPSTGPTARPTTSLNSGTAPGPASTVTPRPNVSSPAPPSAGVLDQITGHKRFTDEAFHKSHSINGGSGVGSHIGSHTAISHSTANSSGISTAGGSSNTNTAPPVATTSSTPSATVRNATSSVVNKTTSDTSNHKIINPVSNPTVNSVSNHATSAVASNRADNQNNILANTTSTNIASNQAGGPPVNIAKVQTSSTPSKVSNSAIHTTPSSMPTTAAVNHIKPASSAGSIGVIQGGPASNSSSNTSSISTSHTTSTITDKTKSDNTPNTTIIPVNRPGTIADSSLIENVPGATSGSKITQSQNSNMGIKTTIASGLETGPGNSAHTRGHVNSPTVNNPKESTNSTGQSGKVASTGATTMEHTEPVAFKAPAPIHNMSSPAPPSAGVVDQIAGHKRSIDEGPGSANAEQPEPKKMDISSA